jgi:hypothetical protein
LQHLELAAGFFRQPSMSHRHKPLGLPVGFTPRELWADPWRKFQLRVPSQKVTAGKQRFDDIRST